MEPAVKVLSYCDNFDQNAKPSVFALVRYCGPAIVLDGASLKRN
jgi:hypothetical protein